MTQITLSIYLYTGRLIGFNYTLFYDIECISFWNMCTLSTLGGLGYMTYRLSKVSCLNSDIHAYRLLGIVHDLELRRAYCTIMSRSHRMETW
jgi:hypothetical protein